MNPRETRAFRMLENGLEPEQFRYGLYFIPSESGKNRYLVNVKGNEDFWTCECPDFKYRQTRCKHIHLLRFWLSLRKRITERDSLERGLDSIPIIACSCGSRNIMKNGTRKNKSIPKQRFLCSDCGKSFIADRDFRKVKGDPKIITMVMDLWFKGISLRKIQDHILQFYGFKVHYSTIYRWIRKFMQYMNKYVNKHRVKVSDTWHADEMMVKSKGKYVWLWNVMDSKTRFLLSNQITEGRFTKDARQVFKEAKEQTDKIPYTLITDGLQAYKKAFKKEFWRRKGVRREHKIAGLRADKSNNLIERFHGTVRERNKVIRGFKGNICAEATMEAYRTYYNFIRKHMALDGKTPSEIAGMDLNLTNNRWLSLLRKSLNGSDI